MTTNDQILNEWWETKDDTLKSLRYLMDRARAAQREEDARNDALATEFGSAAAIEQRGYDAGYRNGREEAESMGYARALQDVNYSLNSAALLGNLSAAALKEIVRTISELRAGAR